MSSVECNCTNPTIWKGKEPKCSYCGGMMSEELLNKLTKKKKVKND